MGNSAKMRTYGYKCPVRGCPKRKNSLYSAKGLTMHILSMHGIKEFEKRLKIKNIQR